MSAWNWIAIQSSNSCWDISIWAELVDHPTAIAYLTTHPIMHLSSSEIVRKNIVISNNLWSQSFSKHDKMSWDSSLVDCSHQSFWSRNRLREVNQTNYLMFTSLNWTLSDYTWQSLFLNWSIRQNNARQRWDVKSSHLYWTMGDHCRFP